MVECKHGIGCSSGTDAILLALMALGIGPGDEVLVPTFTFFATAGCVARVGATPVFVDACPVCFNIDMKKAAAKITSKTKAIIPVHLFGQSADMDAVMALANEHHLFVIEDGAQAIGAKYKGKPVGSIGHFGTYSFFPSKNLGGFGDGGGRGRPDGLPPGVAPPDGAAAGGGRAGAPAIDPERLREAQLRQRQGELARLMLMWFLTTDAPAAWLGTAQSADGTADVIEITPAGGQATRVFLDSATHMPLMMTNTGFGGGGRGRRGGGPDGRGAVPNAQAAAPAPAAPTPGAPTGAPEARRGGGPPQSVTIETHLSEYKAVNGIKLPHLITRGVNGQTNEEWEIKNYRVNPNLKSNTFSK